MFSDRMIVFIIYENPKLQDLLLIVCCFISVNIRTARSTHPSYEAPEKARKALGKVSEWARSSLGKAPEKARKAARGSAPR